MLPYVHGAKMTKRRGWDRIGGNRKNEGYVWAEGDGKTGCIAKKRLKVPLFHDFFTPDMLLK